METEEIIYIGRISSFRGDLISYRKEVGMEPNDYIEHVAQGYFTYDIIEYVAQGYFTYEQRSLRLKLI